MTLLLFWPNIFRAVLPFVVFLSLCSGYAYGELGEQLEDPEKMESSSFETPPRSVIPWMLKDYYSDSDDQVGMKVKPVMSPSESGGIKVGAIKEVLGLENNISLLAERARSGEGNVWGGLDYGKTVTFVKDLDGKVSFYPKSGQVLRDLIVAATPYPSTDEEISLALTRISALYKFGDLHGAYQMGKQVGNSVPNANNDILSNTDLLLGRESRLCLELLRQRVQNDHLRIFCLIVSGKRRQANFAINVLASETTGSSDAVNGLLLSLLEPEFSDIPNLRTEYFTPLGLSILKHVGYQFSEEDFRYDLDGGLSVLTSNGGYIRINKPLMWGLFNNRSVPDLVRVYIAERLVLSGLMGYLDLKKEYEDFFESGQLDVDLALEDLKPPPKEIVDKDKKKKVIRLVLEEYVSKTNDDKDEVVYNIKDWPDFKQRLALFYLISSAKSEAEIVKNAESLLMVQGLIPSVSEEYVFSNFISDEFSRVSSNMDISEKLKKALFRDFIIAGNHSAAVRFAPSDLGLIKQLQLELSRKSSCSEIKGSVYADAVQSFFTSINPDDTDAPSAVIRRISYDDGYDQELFSKVGAVAAAFVNNGVDHIVDDSISDTEVYFTSAKNKGQVGKSILQILNILAKQSPSGITNLGIYKSLRGLLVTNLDDYACRLGVEMLLYEDMDY